MKKKLLAMILAAMMLTGSMGVTASATSGIQISQSQTTTQKKIITKKKQLTEKQLIQLTDDRDKLFECKELSTAGINSKTNELELEVVGKVSSALQKKIDAIKKKYGINVKVQIVDDYEEYELPIEPEKPHLTEEQLVQLNDEMDDLLNFKVVLAYRINEKNELELDTFGDISLELQNKVDAIEKKYGIKVLIGKADGFGDWLAQYEKPQPEPETEEERIAREKEMAEAEKQAQEQAKLEKEKLESWYNSLSQEQKSFYQQKIWENKEKHAKPTNDFANYLRDKLSSKNYSYIREYRNDGKIEIGVPSAKAMEQAIEIVETYREAKGIKYMDYKNPEKFVNVEYRLCKYSYSDILKAYNSVLKDSFIKKNRANGNIYSIDKIDGCLYIRYTEKTKEMEKCRDSSKYKDMIVFEEFIKRNPE